MTDDVDERLLRNRVIIIGATITNEVADRVSAQLLLLAGEDPAADIALYINSPGGSVNASQAILDTMELVEPDVSTTVMGLAAGTAALVLILGAPGKRRALPRAQVLLLQASPGDDATGFDAERLESLDRHYAELVALRADRPVAEVRADMATERWFDAEQALQRRYVDRIVENASGSDR